MERKWSIVQLLFYSDCHQKFHQRRLKMQVLMVFFGLVSFLKTDAVLDHLPESIKVKFVGPHDSYCTVWSSKSYENSGSDIANDIL